MRAACPVEELIPTSARGRGSKARPARPRLELDCDGAAGILARPEVQKTEPGVERWRSTRSFARGSVIRRAQSWTSIDEKRDIEVRWQDEHDRALGPLLFETVAAAREALTRDLHVDWPKPTRIAVVRDPVLALRR